MIDLSESLSAHWNGPSTLDSRRIWSIGQACFYLALATLLAGLAWRYSQEAPVWGGALAIAAYAAVVLTRTAAVLAGLIGHDVERGGGAANDTDWPVYTILLPVYREAGVLPGLVRSLAALDYPRDRLDAILLVEEDDLETRAAAGRLATPWLRVLVVPPGEPRTKPRACNFGLAAARGEFVVVFDAEDRPESDQLKQAVRVFRRSAPTMACLQAHLNYYNARDNLLTRCFALEYAAWFDLYLPGLHSLGGVIPLGGTSNHFRTAALLALHGWDPWNVTEDCELGVRLARAGLETRILESTTWEEAVSKLGPWLRQRSRWVKGYWQTHLVHTRAPLATVKKLGAWRANLMLLTVGGQVALLLVNPLCWIITVLWLAHPWPLHDPERPLSRALLVGTVVLMLFNVFFVAIHALAAVRRKRFDLLPASLLMPLYWFLVSVGAWRGVLQSFTAPFKWEKTPHGLGASAPPPVDYAAVGALVPPVCDDAFPAQPPPRERRRALRRWGSVAAVLAALVGIALVAGPLARWLVIVFGVVPLSGPNAADERVVEACWIGRTAAVLRVNVEPAEWPGAKAWLGVSAMPLAAVIHLKVGDGTFFQTRVSGLACPVGGPTNLEVTVPLDAGWTGREPGAVWGPWCLRRVRAAGLRLYGADGPPHLARLTGLEARGVAPEPPLVVSVQSGPVTGAVWRTWESSFDLSREYANPFDPEEIDVWGLFTSPTGAVVCVPAFYTCDFVRVGPGPAEKLAMAGVPHWAVRFLPPEPGAWTWRLEARDRSGATTVTPDRLLTVGAATTPGPVRVEPGRPWFRRADGSFFYPVGLNIRSPTDTYTDSPDWPLYSPNGPAPDSGTLTMEEYLRRMGAAGITLGRVWLSPWFGGLEWTAQWNGFHGLGRYNLQNAWRVDRVLAAGEQQGVMVELALQSHGPFTFKYDVQWDDNPYNRSQGGPLYDPSDVMTDPAAKRWMNNRLRYCAARWGASPALFGWTFWIEADLVNRDAAVVLDWHREATGLMRRLDQGAHPMSTEFTTPNFCMDVWDLQGIGYIQAAIYNFGNGLPNDLDETLRWLGGKGKPLFIEEYAGHPRGGDPRWVAHEIHDGLWLAWVQPYAASPMAWWWNFIFAHHLERLHARFAEFIRGEDLRSTVWRYPRDLRAAVPWLRVRARAADDRADLWLCGPASEVRYHSDGLEEGGRAWRRLAGNFDPLASNPGRLFDLPAGATIDLAPLRLQDGDYRVEIWDTWTTTQAVVRQVSVRQGRGQLVLPALQRDAAIRIRAQPAAAGKY